jgi:signal transduction histidine kinase
MNKIKPLILIVLLPLGAFGLTKNPLTGPFKLQMLLLVLLVFAFYWFSLSRKKISAFGSSKFVYLSIALVLFLVGATGWFFSPFFFILYLLGITLALMYTPAISIGFIVTLVILFSFNIGEVDLTYDFLIVLSLLSTIPVGLFLRREYLKLKESAKEILILQHEHEKYRNELEEVLANTMNNFAVNLRQPINDIKQLAFRIEKVKGKDEEKKDIERIIASSEEALRMLKNFEEKTTGKKLLSTISMPPQSTP